MLKSSFNTYTGVDNYWRSTLLVRFDQSMQFLCSGDQVLSDTQFSIGNKCINHSIYNDAIKNTNSNISTWLDNELNTLKHNCPTIITSVHTEKHHYMSEINEDDITIGAITTAGISTNAVSICHDKRKDNLATKLGTINIILYTNVNLTQSAMTQALGMVYEAKTSLFYNNNWKSSYSSNIASGTGTDSVIIASSVDESYTKVNYTGSHSIISKMIATVVSKSIQGSIDKQGVDSE